MKSRKQKIKKAKAVILFFCFFVFLFFFNLALAADNIPPPVIQVDIGGFQGFNENEGWTQTGGKLDTVWISKYISVLYTYGVGVAAILAILMIMIGGFLWLTSGGSPNRIEKGRDFILSALAGLLLALFSFIILQSVNPQLTSPRSGSGVSGRRSPLLVPSEVLGQPSGTPTNPTSVQTAGRRLDEIINPDGYSDYYMDDIDIFLNQMEWLENPDIARYTGIAETQIDFMYGQLNNQINQLIGQGVNVRGIVPVRVGGVPANGQMNPEQIETYLESQGLTVTREGARFRISNNTFGGEAVYDNVSYFPQSIDLDSLGRYYTGTIILANPVN